MIKTTELVKTSSRVVPMIYAYTTPGVVYHDGYIKIGYTEQNVDQRIWQQTHTAGIKAKKEWQGNATYEDGSGENFIDKDFHRYLKKEGVKQPQEEGNEYFDPQDINEWFHIEPEESENKFNKFRKNRGLCDTKDVFPYVLREEQEEAVLKTKAYMENHENGEFLWNAKPRFGKTLTTYDFIKRIKAQKVLIVTNRPAIANSWYDDYEKFVGRQGGYFFVSRVDGIIEKPLVIGYDSYKKYEEDSNKSSYMNKMGLIEFVSLQDLKGSIHFGGNEGNKLSEVIATFWDVLVIDEAHEGVDTYRTDLAFNRVRRKFTLHLSGTPFKAIANDKFPSDAIYNWTYADEQSKKLNWQGTGENPYGDLPKLNMLTYQMSEIVKDELTKGTEIDGETRDYAFDLNEFFATKNSRFVHNESVDKFLDALTTLEKYPFSTPKLRNELKHTFWLLNRVESATLLAKKLEEHPVFKDYKIILAAGDGKLDDDTETKKAFAKVKDAIKKYDKTITLSVGQLTTGVTIPEWTAVLMLSNIKSPSLYMQAAFRAQNPCLFKFGTESFRKENAYVFDFDPARTLVTFEQFANDLYTDTAAGHGDMETRRNNVRELLNFFPVIGEDDNGEMVELDAAKVLSIPRKIKSQEVVKSCFLSDYLFQNITNVFHAPSEVMNIIKQFTPAKEPKTKGQIDDTKAKEILLDSNGDVVVEKDVIIGLTPEVFGEKIFKTIEDVPLDIDVVSEAPSKIEEQVKRLKDAVKEKTIATVLQTAKDHYGSEIKKSTEHQITRQLSSLAERKINTVVDDYKIKTKTLESERDEALDNLVELGKTKVQVEDEYDQKNKENIKELGVLLKNTIDDFVEEAQQETLKTVERNKIEKEKLTIEDSIKDHLRGFSRTIPSFLMAYGDSSVTLETFDQNIPDVVFKEVTSITLGQFRFLRDGGDYEDINTGETKHFDGHLFEPVVFNDSVKEFLRKKKELANYFEDSHKEDIFDYIPPQKNNQIFTPRAVVQNMVDLLEKENPGCFDDPTKSFADLYMKSGMYISEIVKRLYRSEKMKQLYPNNKERLAHIFAKQVYGCAPTEILYRICLNYLLGFADTIQIEEHNIKLCDTLKFAKEGTLEKELAKLFEL